jgi:predicted nucleic acid-binding protein
MIVADASALADILLPTELGAGLVPAVRSAAGGLHAPSLIDAEVTSAVRRAESRGELSAERAADVLRDLAGFPLTRHEYRPLLGRAWELRRNLTVYDALYAALAEAASAPLLTTDLSLARAVADHTDIELIPTG